MELPNDAILEILLRSPITEVLNFCQTNHPVCRSNHLWVGLLQRDALNFTRWFRQQGFTTQNYRGLYLSLNPVDFYYNNRFIQRELTRGSHLINEIAFLGQNVWIALYLDGTRRIVGYQTAMGVDPQVTPELLSSVREVRIYDNTHHPDLVANLQDPEFRAGLLG